MPRANPLITPDPAAFRAEWEAGAAALDARTGKIIQAVCYEGRLAAQVGQEMRLTRERIRQLADLGMQQMRAYAAAHPEGHLAHATHTLTKMSEQAALRPWKFRRMGSKGRLNLAAQIHRLGGVTTPQPHLLAPPCNLIEPPGNARPTLRNPKARILAVIREENTSDDSQLHAAMLEQVPELRHWPDLDIRLLLTTHAPEAIAADGSIKWSPANPTAHYARQALEQAGKPLHKRDLLTAVSQLATADGHQAPLEWQLAHTLANQPDFRWTSKGTYGLTRWGVGTSSDCRPNKGQWSPVRQELRALMSDGQDRDIQAVKLHLMSRFTIKERTIYLNIQQEPDLYLEDGVVRRGHAASAGRHRKKTSPQKRPSQTTQAIDPKALRNARQRRPLTITQAAVRAGIPPQSLTDYEAGRAMPTSARLLALAREMGVTAEEVLIHPPEPHRYNHLLWTRRRMRLH